MGYRWTSRRQRYRTLKLSSAGVADGARPGRQAGVFRAPSGEGDGRSAPSPAGSPASASTSGSWGEWAGLPGPPGAPPGTCLGQSSARRARPQGWLATAQDPEAAAEAPGQACRWFGGLYPHIALQHAAPHGPPRLAAGRRRLTRPTLSALLSSSGIGTYTARATQLAKMVSRMIVSKGLRPALRRAPERRGVGRCGKEAAGGRRAPTASPGGRPAACGMRRPSLQGRAAPTQVL